MKRKLTLFLATMIVVTFALNAVIYFTYHGRIELTNDDCISMQNRDDEGMLVARRVAAKIAARPAYVYAISYFVVYSSMKVFWTKQMVASLTNCPDDLQDAARPAHG
jgi:hypothetical protein